MPYAIMQRELYTPGLDQLKEAFRAVPNLTALDAQSAANEASGILMRGLEVEAASALQDSLMKAGLETMVVEESDLPVTPPAKLVKQMDFLPAHLVMYDPMGRSFLLPWRDIYLVAAGNVRLPEYRKGRAVPETPLPGAPPANPTGEGKKEADQFHLMLEIVLAGGIARYSVMAEDFVFNHLGTRLTKNLAQNFSLLVQDLAEYAPHAGLNRGAYLICQRTEPVFSYPSKAAFFEEITWMLWRIGMS